jgi:tRNA A-37 threonylcarbamoyl transferase component Bud32
MFKDICECKFPQARTSRERKAITLLKNAGFIVPQIVAWGEKRCFGLPRAGILFLQPPDGQTLPAFLANELDAAARRQGVEKAEATLMDMHSKGFFWPDCRAENFLLLPDGQVALVNLGSVKHNKTLSQEERQQQFEVFYASLVGADL